MCNCTEKKLNQLGTKSSKIKEKSETNTEGNHETILFKTLHKPNWTHKSPDLYLKMDASCTRK